MVKTGFFNAINGDRAYNADDISNYFQGLLTDGVFKGYLGGFEITEESITSNSFTMESGKCIVFGKYILSTDSITFEVDTNINVGGSREDCIIAYTDLELRESGLMYIKDTSSSSNSRYLTNTSTYKFLRFYTINVYYEDNEVVLFVDTNPEFNYITFTNSISRLTKTYLHSGSLDGFTPMMYYPSPNETGIPAMYIYIYKEQYSFESDDVIEAYINGAKIASSYSADSLNPGIVIEDVDSEKVKLIIELIDMFGTNENIFSLNINYNTEQSVEIYVLKNQI